MSPISILTAYNYMANRSNRNVINDALAGEVHLSRFFCFFLHRGLQLMSTLQHLLVDLLNRLNAAVLNLV